MADFKSYDRSTKRIGAAADSFSDSINKQLSEAQQRHEQRLAVMNAAYEIEKEAISTNTSMNARRNVVLNSSAVYQRSALLRDSVHEPSPPESERRMLPGFLWLGALGLALTMPVIGITVFAGLFVIQASLWR